jgi:predicted AAA+ superfamily ATPase
LKTFEDDFDFINYQDNDFKADRIIIQLESLLKLQSPFLDDLVPVYDLIILDEIESILKQFSSVETFKDRSRSTFEILQHIILASLNDSGKLISMDGDLGIGLCTT